MYVLYGELSHFTLVNLDISTEFLTNFSTTSQMHIIHPQYDKSVYDSSDQNI